jgi:uncharacterized protein YecE (DUF72 family)
VTAPEQPNPVRIGPAGWAYEDWKGTVYPKDMPRSLHPLTFLSSMFDTVEINVTFYRPVDSKMSANWVTKVAENPRFKFAVKLWERYTHERETWPTNEERRKFCDGLEPLRANDLFGVLLIQFPWSFKRTPENRSHLAHIVETFASYPIAVEFRHDSWLQPVVFEGLRDRNVAFCNIDQPIFDNSIGPTGEVTADIAYVRLHGRNHEHWFRKESTRDQRYDYLYGGAELHPWIDRIRRMRAIAKETYVVTNNHFRGQAVINAQQIQQMLIRS